jgi:hypothetical protein
MRPAPVTRVPNRTLSALAVGALLLAVMIFAAGPSDAGEAAGAEVSVLHGIGPAPSTVDIYLGPADATEWDLLLADVSYGDLAALGTVAAGNYNALVCNAVAPPEETIAACAAGAVNGNTGTNFVVPASGSITLVAAYSGPDTATAGRPTVVGYTNDVSCVDEGDGRLGARHAATAPAVDVLVDGTVVLADVVWGAGADLTVPAGTYEVEIQLSSDGTTVLGPVDVDVAEQELLVLYAVGNPQFEAAFDVLVQSIELPACPPPPTTTTTTAPPVTPEPATPAVPVTATPTFTG